MAKFVEQADANIRYTVKNVQTALSCATHAVLIVLVTAIQITLDNDNGGDEARIYQYTC